MSVSLISWTSSLLAAGWLAQALAARDADIDAGIAAYEAGEHEKALEHYAAAQERRGERPEIAYNRGLVELATEAAADESFRRATESDDPAVKASAHLALGNRAFATEQWDEAVSQYTACLRARPDHQNAKWNLELALLKQKEAEEKKEEEEKDEENQDEENQDEEKQDEEKQDEEKQDEEKQDEEKQDEEKQDEEKQDEEKQDEEKQDEEKQDEEKQDEEKQDEEKQDEQEQNEQEQNEQEQPPSDQAPAPIDQLDLDRALEQLDEEDQFMLGQPRGGNQPVDKDW